MRRKDREISDRTELEKIILKSDVCRLSFADEGIPYIVTMNFGYVGGSKPHLFFHCANEGRKIDLMKKNNFVCFQMDTDHELFGGPNGCDWGMKFSSIVGYGRLSQVTDSNEKLEGLNCLMRHYTKKKSFSYDESVMMNTTVLRLDIEEMTGKRKV